tara:strand:- start:190 stop:513 length:324 start_codon:yes stop_codon:yes gene_type:complete
MICIFNKIKGDISIFNKKKKVYDLAVFLDFCCLFAVFLLPYFIQLPSYGPPPHKNIFHRVMPEFACVVRDVKPLALLHIKTKVDLLYQKLPLMIGPFSHNQCMRVTH